MSDFTVKDVIRVYSEKTAMLALAGLCGHQPILDEFAKRIGDALVDQSGRPHNPTTIFEMAAHNVPLEEKARDLFSAMAAWRPGSSSR